MSRRYTERGRERREAPARPRRRRKQEPGYLWIAKRLTAVSFSVIVIYLIISVASRFQVPRDAVLTGEPDLRKMSAVSAPGIRVETAQTEEQVKEKLTELQEQFPDGRYWNHMGAEIDPDDTSWNLTSSTPCDHKKYGDRYCNRYDGATKEFFPQYDHLMQCLGFTSMLSDQIFGESAPAVIYRDFDKVRVGDQIRLTGNWHSMLITEKGGDYVKVAECDEDCMTCKISWGRTLSKSDLASYGEEIEYITRYEE